LLNFELQVATAPKPRWKTLSHRRLQTWPSDLTKNTLLEAPLPQWLVEPVIPRILSLPRTSDGADDNIFTDSPHIAPNHVLINEYLSGQGIMPHKDGAAYHPVVCTVSLGSSLCLDIYGSNEDGTRESKPRWRILQEPRSLLITTGSVYTDYLHGIADVSADLDLSSAIVANWSLLRAPEEVQDGTNERQTRTSLTYRDVLKVSKLGGKLGLFGGRR
jgi:alkylated DNA repair protein alkB family protein 6